MANPSEMIRFLTQAYTLDYVRKKFEEYGYVIIEEKVYKDLLEYKAMYEGLLK